MISLPCFSKGTGETERQLSIQGPHVDYKSLPHGEQYISNEVVTSLYTWWNFIPKNLIEQFSNMANIYFLLIGILQIIPQISTSNGLPTMYYPLAFIIVVSALRAIVEDIVRHRADAKRNSYPYDVLTVDPSSDKAIWAPTASGELKVGSIIRLKKNDMIPADLLLLGTSNSKGHCFIDKANLNGETKLEVYTSIRETRFAVPVLPEGTSSGEVEELLKLPPSDELAGLAIDIEYELPNKRFDSFRGTMWLKSGHNASSGPTADRSAEADSPREAKSVQMSTPSNSPSHSATSSSSGSLAHNEQGVNIARQGKELRCSGHDLLMRETNLKNTDYIIGLIVYTGNDTKIQRSNLEGEKPKVKVSKIMRLVNLYLIWMFLFQCLLCIVGGIVAGVWYLDNGDSWYFYEDDLVTTKTSAVTGILAFFTWMINLSYLVPISLVVSAEMVKFIMSAFINQDVYLYHAPIKKPTHCNSSTIHEDLGLVNYICSDKTGTLTQNKMEFRYAMCCDNTEYGSKLTDIARAVRVRQQELIEREAGTYKPKPLPLWSDLVNKYRPPRAPNKKTGYDIECCNRNVCLRGRRCPTFLKYCCWSKKYTFPPGSVDPYSDDLDSEEDIFAAVNPSLAGSDANCFNKTERKHLLSQLYPKSNDDHVIEVQKHIQTYMLHMTLSNTVKPYYEGPKEQPILKFQPESAEELAMVQFSTKLGYTKLPEKEENEKSAEERRVGANTFISIQPMNPETLKPEGEPELRTYVFLAVLGFTSARARVSVFYQDLSTGRILCMIKGQDTTVMQFVTLEDTATNDENLMSTLKECSDNGLRTLVAGHAERDYSWWEPWGKKYIDLKNAAMDEAERAKAEHKLYEDIERSAEFTYLGCIGLEDQLQPLVPECIQACLRANIKVWMITGDKLETARNIGLACNLIDSDMQPQVKAGDTVQDAMSALDDSRLIEITGEWNRLFQNKKELATLFDIIDFNHDGLISVAEIAILMQTLHTGVDEADLCKMVLEMLAEALENEEISLDKTAQITEKSEKPTKGKKKSVAIVDLNKQRGLRAKLEQSQEKMARNNSFEDSYHTAVGGDGSDSDTSRGIEDIDEDLPVNDYVLPEEDLPRRHSFSRLTHSVIRRNNIDLDTRDPRTIAVDKDSFVAILQRFEKSPYEAILYDVTEGLERYERIQDHIVYPVSMLVSRDAFLVMFPEQGGGPSEESLRFKQPTAEELEDLRRAFFFLASVSKSLIFARAQPSMKKKMVTEIQLRQPEAITLAIGDGANDTDMITAAHIGVGIAGVEGTAATNSADYAIGTFRMLHTLLFVHGFWSYQRVSLLVCFLFYKAALLAFTQFLFGIDSGFSGQQFFNDPLLQVYNVINTSLPIIFYAVFDKHLPRQTAENNVIAYKEQQYQSFNFYVFFLWIFRSLCHSVLLYFIPRLCYRSDNPFPTYGDHISRGTMDLFFFSGTVYFATALLPTFNVLFITKSIHVLNWLAIGLSLIAIFFLSWFLSAPTSFVLWFNPQFIGGLSLMYASPTFWLVLVITIMVPILAELTWQVFLVQYFPSLTQILQEQLWVIRQQEKEINKGGVEIVGDGSKGNLSQSDPSSNSSATSIDNLTLKTRDEKQDKIIQTNKLTVIQKDGTVIKTQGSEKAFLAQDATPTEQKPSYGALDTNSSDKLDEKDKHEKSGVLKIRLERPVLQPEDEHLWLDVKPDNIFLRSGIKDQARGKKQNELVQSVIQQNKVNLGVAPASPTEESSNPFAKVFGGKDKQKSPETAKEEAHAKEGEAMRSGFVRALLRFRNQTGSIFDSAAQSQFHNTVVAYKPTSPTPTPTTTTTTTTRTTTTTTTTTSSKAGNKKPPQEQEQEPQKQQKSETPPTPKITIAHAPEAQPQPLIPDEPEQKQSKQNKQQEQSAQIDDDVEKSFEESVCRSIPDDLQLYKR